MSLTLVQTPGLIDVPDANIADGLGAFDFILAAISENAKFPAIELFYDEVRDGEVVPLPVSRIDGYNFARDELRYAWTLRSTLNTSQMASAAGEMQMQSPVIDPATGEAHSLIDYYVQGGAFQHSADGLLGVWTFACRAFSGLALAADPSYTDLADAVFNQDEPFKSSNVRALSANAKLAAVRTEIFGAFPIVSFTRLSNVVTVATKVPHNLAAGHHVVIGGASDNSFNSVPNDFVVAAVLDDFTFTFAQVGGDGQAAGGMGLPVYANGQTVSLPKSPVTGKVYTRSDLKYLPFWVYTGKSDHSGPSGGGRIRYKNCSVNAGTGLVATQVNYWDNRTEFVTHDGLVAVLVVATRSIGSVGAVADTFSDIDESKFFCQQIAGDNYLKTVNKNAKFMILRPEVFSGLYTNGQTVPIPTAADGYTYSRAELIYVYSQAASTVTGAKGAIQVEIFGVDPNTGVVSCRLDYNNNGQARQQTTEGQLLIETWAFRQHQTTVSLTEQTPIAPSEATAVFPGCRPLTNPLTATDAGASVTINIAAFTMRVGATDVAVNSGSVTALGYSTLYYIYYDDPTLGGGAVTFHATTTKESALNGNGRLFVGSIRTPAAGGVDTQGNADGGVGAQAGTIEWLRPRSDLSSGCTNPAYAYDADDDTYAQIYTASTYVYIQVQDFTAPVRGRATGSITLKILNQVIKTGTGTIMAVCGYSLDAGATWVTVYNVDASRALQTDEVVLPLNQNYSKLWVYLGAQVSSGTATVTSRLHEVWLEAVS